MWRAYTGIALLLAIGVIFVIQPNPADETPTVDAQQLPAAEVVTETSVPLLPDDRSHPVFDSDEPQNPTAIEDCVTRTYNDIAYQAPHEFALYQSMQGGGSDARHLENLDGEILENLAAQGDSMAMLVTAHHILADGKRSAALAHSATKDPRVRKFAATADADAKSHFRKAADWYYQAALHGRLVALQDYGFTFHWLEVSAVDLGWVAQPDFDAMTEEEREALTPGLLYSSMLHELVPGLQTGPMRYLQGDIAEATTPLAGEIQSQLIAEFHASLEASGLPVPEGVGAMFPRTTKLFDEACQAD